METAPLKSFATGARTALIREVNARIAAVLAPASKERVESASAVTALERDIAAEGGGETGRDAIAAKAAYTWFNRIIALRFMDANGYTGIGIVSPLRGQTAGQPEVLADAKRGNIDPAVVTNTRAIEAITALLDGTRRSDDAQGEAYALLLAEYCRHWNRSMPFMFEREGDYTELLIPANLLADDSVLARTVTVLTEDVCQNVEVIGWLYQFYISERKAEVFAGFGAKGEARKLAGAVEIPAATQLFTPHWIVRSLVENSLGRLWLLNRPASRLAERMDYYVESADEETEFLKVSSPEELKIVDPAVGSGHMLTYAFDLLYAIYEEEGYAPADISGLILRHNLYGTEIDPRAGALAAFALAMRARARHRDFFSKGVQPNICVLEPIRFDQSELNILAGGHVAASAAYREHDCTDTDEFWNAFERADTFGSLIQPRADLVAPLKIHLEGLLTGDDDLLTSQVHSRADRVVEQSSYLSRKYHIVVTNPPYMGSGNMAPLLSGWLSEKYPSSKSDLMTAFMERARQMVTDKGYWAMINIPTWMFLSSYDELRRQLLMANTVSVLCQLGRGVFGSDFGSVAFVVHAQPPAGRRGVYRKLFIEHVSVRKNAEIEALFLDSTFQRFEVDQTLFQQIPGLPIAYWVEPELLALFGDELIGDRFDVKAGVGTRNDDLFLRFHWEVSSAKIGRGRRWILTDKAGEFRKWYAGFTYVMDWEDDGHRIRNSRNADGSLKSRPQNIQYMFLPGVTWGKVGAGASSFRWRPEGFGFNDAAPAIFGTGAFDLLGQLNSSVNKRLVEIKGSTVNVQTGMVAEIPIVKFSPDVTAEHREYVGRAVELSRLDWDTQETSVDFKSDRLCESYAPGASLSEACEKAAAHDALLVSEMTQLEAKSDALVRRSAGVPADAVLGEPMPVSLLANPAFKYGRKRIDNLAAAQAADSVRDLVSYAVGCMFGRYSLDEPGPVLATQGDTLQEYMAKVPTPSFMPDRDNVIPIVDGDWFEDDIVARFRQFLRAAFGEEHFEENLRFVTESLGVNDLRDYFVKSFYQDHVKRYKKRPIYWLFSSPKSSFSALIYMHRYTPSTVSTVLNEYLREFKAKLEASRQHHVRLAASDGTPREKAAAEKEVDRLRKVLLELDEYEHDVLYPLATQQITIDLDDGVKANYPKFGAALKKIAGLEASDE